MNLGRIFGSTDESKEAYTVVTDLNTHVTPTSIKAFPARLFLLLFLIECQQQRETGKWLNAFPTLSAPDLSVLVLTAAEGLLANMWRQYCWISMGTGAKGPAGNLGWATIEPLIRQVLTSKLLSTILIQQDVQITLSPLLRKVLQWYSEVPRLLVLKIDAGLLIKLRRQSNELQTYFLAAYTA